MAVDKKNIFLSDTVRNYPYTSRSAFSTTRIPDRPDRGTFSKMKFRAILNMGGVNEHDIIAD